MLLLNAGALAAAMVFAVAAGAGRRISRLCLATLAGYLLTVHSTVLLAGLAGHLTVRGLAAAITAAFLVGAWLAAIRSRRPAPPTAAASR